MPADAMGRLIERHEWEKMRNREKVAELMMRLSLATGHGDTLDDLLVTLEGEAARRFQLEYERGRADATAAIIAQQSAPPWYGKKTRIERIRAAGLSETAAKERDELITALQGVLAMSIGGTKFSEWECRALDAARAALVNAGVVIGEQEELRTWYSIPRPIVADTKTR